MQQQTGRWSVEDTKELKRLYKNEARIPVLAKRFKRSPDAIYRKIAQLKLKRKRLLLKYTREQEDAVRKYYPTMPFGDFMDTFFKGHNPRGVKSIARRLGVKPLETTTAMGRALTFLDKKEAKARIFCPLKTVYLSIRADNRPTWFIKTEQPNTYEPLHHYVYKKYIGPIKDGEHVAFLDGDRFNVNPANLFAGSQAAVAAVSLVPQGNADLKKVLINLKELELCTI